MGDEQYYSLLVQRFANRTATDEELEVFIQLMNEGKLDVYLTEAMNNDAGITAEDKTNFSAPAKTRWLWPQMIAAASVLLMVLGSYAVLHQAAPQKRIVRIPQQSIVPGRHQATLTLANGQKIMLSKGLSGKLAQQGNIQINVTPGSELVYNGSGVNADVQYNTLSTTIGEQSPYPLVLGDGTKVWLNSNSSITFPTAFNSNIRQVKITGEAYFEVAHNSSNPFTVKAGNQTVEDIGTAFNINSYDDEPAIRTTLVKGSAKVSANGANKILKPGQQSLVNRSSMSLKTTDTEAETAWLTGKFVFQNEELHSVMRQLARWYKIDVIYDDDPNNIVLGGGFSKSRNISQVLKAFEQTGAVRFTIKGNEVRVTK